MYFGFMKLERNQNPPKMKKRGRRGRVHLVFADRADGAGAPVLPLRRSGPPHRGRRVGGGGAKGVGGGLTGSFIHTERRLVGEQGGGGGLLKSLIKPMRSSQNICNTLKSKI